ncbi:PAS domain-containing sensor histidine kinase [Natroniella sulfidigena]|uniref:sensor histidine kinase n=1 Tax=Natroniella sulfidigena TaxID=723921 RepID=UPI00200AA016|nr:PAS domain-containing sensor histidine kinase [Natroniella sulfidigena]MCK8817871.1 PAS domain-containing sensor histidine kinase [Natroniella sulfidigena]
MNLKQLLKDNFRQEGINFAENYIEILNNSHDIIIYLNLDYKIVWANKAALKELAKTPDEIVGHYCYQAIHNRNQICKDCIAKMTEQTGKVEEDEVVLSNGNKYLIRTYPLKNNQQKLAGIIISALNITKRKVLKEELEQSKLKTKIFANLSHEFKTPLNLTYCNTQMLEAKLKENENFANYNRYLNIIKQNNSRLLKLITNLIDITKINSGAYKLSLQNLDLVDLIKQIVSSIEEYATNKKRNLEFKSEIKSKIIACDPLNLERIILNLLSNAIKFTDSNDAITVNIQDKNSKVLISVKDTGIGIPKDKQQIIFNRFGQVDKSFTRNSEGSGIGLSLVKSLVEIHGGEIYFESEYGIGSEFIVELPVKRLAENNQKELENNHKHSFNKADIELSDIYF